MRAVGWGVLGTGWVVRRMFLPALRAVPPARLAAVGSRERDRSERVVSEHGTGRAGGYDDVLADPAVDVVYVALPNALHAEWTAAALRAGKHVLCEKPLALNLRDLDAVEEAAHAAPGRVLEGFMYRFHPQHRDPTWLGLIDRLGRLLHIQAVFSRGRVGPTDIRTDPALGGGALYDLGCYVLDLLSWRFGGVVDAQAWAELRGGCDWTTHARLALPDGLTATAWCSLEGPFIQYLSVVGERGRLELSGPFRSSGPARATLELADSRQSVELGTGDAFAAQLAHVNDIVATGRSPATTLADTRRWLAVAERLAAEVVTR